MTALGKVFRARLTSAVLSDRRSVPQLAVQSGYSQTHIRAVMDGARPNPTLAFVETMALTLQRDPAWLLGVCDE